MGLVCASKTIWSFGHLVIWSFLGTKVVRRCPFELYDVREKGDAELTKKMTNEDDKKGK